MRRNKIPNGAVFARVVTQKGEIMKEESSSTHEQNVKKLAELLKDVKIAMMTTIDDEGHMHSRPMAAQHREFDGTLWFFSSANSPKVTELKHDQRVQLSYVDSSNRHFVSVSGTAQVVRDKEKAKEFWNPAYKAWFPKGLDDPELALIRVHVERAEYWDSPSSATVHLIGIAKAVLTGKPYDREGGENAKLDLTA
ncbi:MAG: pyridoxamine 5'-phosphate oxidase family protein [Bdellovibrionota bacterium]